MTKLGIVGLHAGGNDYLVKFFALGELAARHNKRDEHKAARERPLSAFVKALLFVEQALPEKSVLVRKVSRSLGRNSCGMDAAAELPTGVAPAACIDNRKACPALRG